MTAETQKSPKIFISYSQNDKNWLNEFKTYLSPLIQDDLLDAWDDTCIKPGQEWKEAIIKAIDAADIGVLLVTPNFLASSFIAHNELPLLLEGKRIFWIAIIASNYEQTPIANYYAANEPGMPLATLRPAKRAPIWVTICRMLTEAGNELHRGDSGSGMDIDPSNVPKHRSSNHNLPNLLTSFIGQRQAVKQIKTWLCSPETRLVTLTGPGGCGKTRLAIKVAHDLVKKFRNGVWMMELAPLSDFERVAQEVAKTLGAPYEDLTAYLNDRHMLLILDNCEHVVDACKKLAQALLSACPNLHILATSQAEIRIPGELTYHVPFLTIPSPLSLPIEKDSLRDIQSYEAVTLFVKRAKLKKPEFELTSKNAIAVVQICHRLDGIPLAIELAAALVRMMEPEEIAKTLVEKRFDILKGEKSLLEMMKWSYNLLPEQERLLLRRLSMFPRSWTRELAEQTCSGEGIEWDEVFRLLQRLVESSLVEEAPMEKEQQDNSKRFRLLETIRQYAFERLQQEDASTGWQSGFFAFFRDRARSNGGSLFELTPNRLAVLNKQWPIFMDAAKAAKEVHDSNTQAELLEGLSAFLLMRGMWTEREQLSIDVLQDAIQKDDHELLARAKNHLALVYERQGRWGDAERLYKESHDLFHELVDRIGQAMSLIGQAMTLNSLGSIYRYREQWDTAIERHQQSLDLFRQVKPAVRVHEGRPLKNLGYVYEMLGEEVRQENPEMMQQYWEQAGGLYEKSLTVFRDYSDLFGLGEALNRRGSLFRRQGKFAEAEADLNDSLVIRTRLNDLVGQARAKLDRAQLRLDQEREKEAEADFSASLTLWKRFGDPVNEGKTLTYLAQLEAAEEENSIPAALELARQAQTVLQSTEDENAKKRVADLISAWETQVNTKQ